MISLHIFKVHASSSFFLFGKFMKVSTGIDGLRERVGEIEQPKNAWIEIARQANKVYIQFADGSQKPSGQNFCFFFAKTAIFCIFWKGHFFISEAFFRRSPTRSCEEWLTLWCSALAWMLMMCLRCHLVKGPKAQDVNI